MAFGGDGDRWVVALALTFLRAELNDDLRGDLYWAVSG